MNNEEIMVDLQQALNRFPEGFSSLYAEKRLVICDINKLPATE